MCPDCNSESFKRRGFFTRRVGQIKRIQRYFCLVCQKSFSTQTGSLTYREAKPHFTQPVFRLLVAGVSQRKSAEILGVNRRTISRKLIRLGAAARTQRTDESRAPSQVSTVLFDEMESFEHTKCKPVSIAVAVESGSRRLLACRVASMPAKGLLAELSRKKYGRRRDDRPGAIREVLQLVKSRCPNLDIIKSDECPRYPKPVAKHLPNIKHVTYKGRRGCVVGQGELKRGGVTPEYAVCFESHMRDDSRQHQALVPAHVVHNQGPRKAAGPFGYVLYLPQRKGRRLQAARYN